MTTGLAWPKTIQRPSHPAAKPRSHRVTNVPVETNNDQPRGRSDRSGCAPAGPAKVPDAAQSSGESEHRGNRGQPAPTCRTRGLYPEAKPRRQKPEPQPKERCTHGQGSDGREPSITLGGRRCRSRFCACHRGFLCRAYYALEWWWKAQDSITQWPPLTRYWIWAGSGCTLWRVSPKGRSHSMATAKFPEAFGCTRRTLPRANRKTLGFGEVPTDTAKSTIAPSGIREAQDRSMPLTLMFSD
jgi:hypothetical protein